MGLGGTIRSPFPGARASQGHFLGSGPCMGSGRTHFLLDKASILGSIRYMTQKPTIPSLSEEFATADLGDRRLTKRLCRIADAAAQHPEASFPVQAGNESQVEGTYRFLNNPRILGESVLKPHVEATVRRASEAGEVLVLHDTSSLIFGGEKPRQGLGPVTGPKSQGFFLHLSFATTMRGQPLGALRAFTWARSGPPKGRRSQRASCYSDDRESLRWGQAVHAVEETLYGHAEVINVQDREGDCMEGFADMVEHGYRFVIRLMHDRCLKRTTGADWGAELFASLHEAPLVLEREVAVSRRGTQGRLPKQLKTFVSREQRLARLEIRAASLCIYPGKGSAAHLPESLTLNFVEVREVDAPEGVEPVLWRLATTEPIDTPEAVARVVDIYCRRWLIEELFKALKTGCQFEKLQLESAKSLGVALALYLSVAWRLLLMRWMDRHEPEAPAERVLTPTQFKVLSAVRARENKPLPPHATVHDVLMAIAAMGGHLKRNGSPGWQVLGRGFDRLLLLEVGWLAAKGDG